MNRNDAQATQTAGDPEAGVERGVEMGRQGGVPEGALERYRERAGEMPSGIARVIEPDQPLVDGVEIDTDLGTWRTYETPGHAPSHVCLFQPERRILISGDHVLGRISLFYDYGWPPDPLGEHLSSLDVVDRLNARLGLSGHRRPFVHVHGHIDGSQSLALARLQATRAAL